MSTTIQGYPRREKLFGDGRLLPLDRNAKIRIMTLARALSHRTEERKHYGVLTAKFLAVLNAILWGFHNSQSGKCFPSYDTIANKADCDPSTVYRAIHALERAALLSWVNRITRVREWSHDMFGHLAPRWRVVRTSNQYTFNDPKPCAKPPNPSNLQISAETENQVLLPLEGELATALPGGALARPGLQQALDRLERAVKERSLATK
jgi:hypothetical protein